MHYLADRREAYEHPRHVLDGVRSVVMLAMDYRTAEPAAAAAGQGRVSRYAWGATDYHDLIRDRLHQLADSLARVAAGRTGSRRRRHGAAAGARVRPARRPRLDRQEHAALNRDRGSWFFLAALLTDVELAYDAAARDRPLRHLPGLPRCVPDRRVSAAVCARCVAVHQLSHDRAQGGDSGGVARRRGRLAVRLRRVPGSLSLEFARGAKPASRCSSRCADNNPIDLIAVVRLDDAAFRARFRHTPLWRPKRRGMLRNAAIVLGNRPTPAAIPALIRGLNDDEPLVRGAAAWALGQLRRSSGCRRSEQIAAKSKSTPRCCSEIDAALAVGDVDAPAHRRPESTP